MMTDPRPILQKALRGRYAIGAFNVNNLELLQGIIAAAEARRAPVILQTSEGAIAYAGMDMLLAMMRITAKRARVPVVIHLDHGKDLAIVQQAIRSGYTSVMYDGSSLPYAENVRNTARIVKLAHTKGIAVEAELGAIRGVEDFVSVSEREAAFTNPEQALDFVERTGCDSLAIAIGTSHGAHKAARSNVNGQVSNVALDIPRLRRIHALLPKTPLVLHGASSVPEMLVGETKLYCSMLGDCQRLEGATGIPDTQIRAAIRSGVAKINTDTDLRIAFTAGLREAIVEEKDQFDPRTLLAPARAKVQQIAEQRIKVFGSRGKHG
ncbi:class II fructose-bisphosphate aldolase family protein [Candidatus Uhrbacteria bacterium]|nr:class II fructose-bisphosphate aldolase family protein [Candidatus Uhrbacteria bacterium]